MIFATVGTQVHFDRLIQAVDEWAGTSGRRDVFAQTGPSSYLPKYIEAKPFIDPDEFRARMAAATIVIGHAGMGSILTALEFGKRIIVMPRRSDLGEHRNDHQVATAKYYGSQGRIVVAQDERELIDKLQQLEKLDEINPISPQASPLLISTIRGFVESPQSSVRQVA